MPDLTIRVTPCCDKQAIATVAPGQREGYGPCPHCGTLLRVTRTSDIHASAKEMSKVKLHPRAMMSKPSEDQ